MSNEYAHDVAMIIARKLDEEYRIETPSGAPHEPGDPVTVEELASLIEGYVKAALNEQNTR